MDDFELCDRMEQARSEWTALPIGDCGSGPGCQRLFGKPFDAKVQLAGVDDALRNRDMEVDDAR
jgi:hypothetical protein